MEPANYPALKELSDLLVEYAAAIYEYELFREKRYRNIPHGSRANDKLAIVKDLDRAAVKANIDAAFARLESEITSHIIHTEEL